MTQTEQPVKDPDGRECVALSGSNNKFIVMRLNVKRQTRAVGRGHSGTVL